MLRDHSAEAEKSQLDKWLEESKENVEALQDYEKIWNASEDIHEYREFDASSSFDAIESKLDFPKSKTRVIPIWSAAAVLLLVVGAYFIFNSGSSSIIQPDDTSYYASHENLGIELKDKSDIWLMKGSSIKELTNFEKERIVALDGQAFFDIEHDPSRAFKIKTAKETITVLGTSFSVLSNDSEFEVFVRSGKVSVNTTKRNIELNPGQKLEKKGGDYIVFESNANALNDWVGHRFTFKNELLSNILTDLENAFDVRFFIQDDSAISSCRVTSRFTNESLTEILDELKTIIGLDYTITENTVSINSVICK